MNQLLFFDETLERRKDARMKLPPPVIDTGWRPPAYFPNLDNAHLISFDTETKDKELTKSGPGWGRDRGHIVGFSIAAEARNGERGKWYFPMRHEFGDLPNMDVNNCLQFAQYALGNKHQIKIGQNLTYDVGWFEYEGVNVAGELNDVMFGEALIDNDAVVNLDYIAHKYLGAGKQTNLLDEWILAAYPDTSKNKLHREIYRSPLMLVGPYGERDADAPLDIWRKQQREIEKEQLGYVYRLECDLIPLMVRMRMQGVPVDVPFFEKLYDELNSELEPMFAKTRHEFGVNLYKTSSTHVGRIMESMGAKVPGKFVDGVRVGYSVTKEWLTNLHHPFADAVLYLREHEKICQTFIKSYILGQNVNGLIYPTFHQLRGDDDGDGATGTKLGRFASSGPNLQNIPSRTKLGKRVRQGFICRQTGGKQRRWRKFDYSQIHYRLLANFAVGPGSNELRQRYINDPKTDYHMDVYKNVAPFMGWNQDYTRVIGEDGKEDWNEDIKFRRRPIKNVNFGLLYGQSAKSLAYKSSMTDAQATEFFSGYHKGAPYVKPTMAAIEKEAQRDGFVTTLLGRRLRFNLWEPKKRNYDNPAMPLPYALAYQKWGSEINRAYGYRAVNYKFQGSEPDIMKHGMRDCLRSGVFDYTGYPLITVHDELDFDDPDFNDPHMKEAFEFIQRTMQNTIQLRVPIYVDSTSGPNWGKSD